MKKIVALLLCALMFLSIFQTSVSAAAGVYKKSPEDLTSIDYQKVVEYHVGKDTTSIPEVTDAVLYHNMPYLQRFSIDEDNPAMSTYKGCLLDKEQTLLVSVPQGMSYVELPPTCVYALAGCLYGTKPNVRKQVKAIIAQNNGGTWPGFTRNFHYIN